MWPAEEVAAWMKRVRESGEPLFGTCQAHQGRLVAPRLWRSSATPE